MQKPTVTRSTRTAARFALWLPAVLAALVGLRAAQAPPPAPAPLDGLRQAFRTPPDDARIMMRWWWFGPTVSRAGIERELRAMRDGGIGGVEIQPVYPVTLDDPAAGLVTHPFLSSAFLEHLRFANDTARSLGMRVDLTLGSGWPYGGPDIGITQAAGRLLVERVAVPPQATRVVLPDIRTGERLLAAFLAPRAPAGSTEGLREVHDIADGVLRLPDAAPAPREVLFFIGSRTGMMVKRAAVGAEGFVLDHYDRGALDHYLERVGRPLVAAFGATPPHAIFCDSLEVFDSDWTTDFLDAFKARRGYDLRPLLPVLLLDDVRAAAVRHDWGQTLTELAGERFMTPMGEWARANKSRFRVQGYGIPPAVLSSNAGVDLPDGEGAQWTTVRASRWAASIGHLYDRPVISSETWTWLHSPSFRATPLDMKAEADLHFLQGINQLVGHGWPYSPEGATYPGWRFYAAGAFNDKNPWWTVMPDVARYLQRVSFLLRQGRPVNDVLLYLPVDDAWAQFKPGRLASFIDALARRVGPDVMPAILGAGFNLDFVDDGVLAGRAHAEQGAIVVGENRYRAIVLPGVERIPPATMRALEGFAAQGVRVIAARRTPDLAPGHLATAADHAGVKAASERLFRGASPAGAFAATDADVAAAMTSALVPDVAFAAGSKPLGAVHRRTADADIYFVANTSNTPISTTATFRVASAAAEQWDPLSGVSEPIRTSPAAGRERTAVQFELPPYGSTVVVFPTRPTPASNGPRTTRPSAPAATGAALSIDLASGWRVRVGQNGATEDWPALRSWTERDETRYFSGVATYEKTLNVPPAMLKPGRVARLDFGVPRAIEPGGPEARMQAWLDAPVREAAVVSVNGVRAGSVWCPPYEIDLTRYLHPGENTLRIEVANLAINAMAGRALPDYRLLNLRYGTRFEPQDMKEVKPLPSGLLGAIRLVSAPGARGQASTR